MKRLLAATLLGLMPMAVLHAVPRVESKFKMSCFGHPGGGDNYSSYTNAVDWVSALTDVVACAYGHPGGDGDGSGTDGRVSATDTGLMPDGSGIVKISFWTFARGSTDHNRANIGVNLDATVALVGIPGGPSDSLTFLFVTPTTTVDAPDVASITIAFPGPWLQNQLDGLAIPGAMLQASTPPATPGTVSISQERVAAGCCAGGPKFTHRVSLAYKLVAPDYCVPEMRQWDPAVAFTNAQDALTRLICADLTPGVANGDISARGSGIYPKLTRLEQLFAESGAKPTLGRVAAARLNETWRTMASTFTDQFKADADFLNLSGLYLSDPADRASLYSFLKQVHFDFQDKKKRSTELLQLSQSLAEASSHRDIGQAKGYLDLIQTVAARPDFVTEDDIDEALIGAFSLGRELVDEAALRRLA